MSFWTRLFGDSDTVREIVSGAKAGIDMAIYTEEERAIAAKDVLEFRLRYMEATNPQNVARRAIALLIVGLWAVLVLIGVLAWPVAQEFSTHVFKVVDEVVEQPASIVVGFYFLTHVVRSAKKER